MSIKLKKSINRFRNYANYNIKQKKIIILQLTLFKFVYFIGNHLNEGLVHL